MTLLSHSFKYSRQYNIFIFTAHNCISIVAKAFLCTELFQYKGLCPSSAAGDRPPLLGCYFKMSLEMQILRVI